MDIGSIFLILALGIVAFLFISRPLFEQSDKERLVLQPEVQQREHLRSTLLAERDRVLNALQELEGDNDLGKLPEDEYGQQRERLLKAGAEALRQLDEINLSEEEPQVPKGSNVEDDELEALIAARRRSQHVEAAPQAAQSQRFCANCGKPLKAGDKFCTACGTPTG